MTTTLSSPQSHRAPRRHAGTSAAGHMLLALLARIERGSIELVAPDGKVRTVSVPWARSGSGFTVMMEGVILTLVKHMPVRTVAREIGEHDTKLWRLIDPRRYLPTQKIAGGKATRYQCDGEKYCREPRCDVVF